MFNFSSTFFLSYAQIFSYTVHFSFPSKTERDKEIKFYTCTK